MINENEIFETIRMIDQENLDIRDHHHGDFPAGLCR